VNAFDPALLPSAFRNLVYDTAERMQTPPDFMAVSLMTCLAAAVGRRVRIQPKAEDIGWVVTPNIWGGICAAPGLLKSPTIEVATQTLNDIQKKWLRKYEAEVKEFKIEQEKFDVRRSVWRELLKDVLKNGGEEPERPADEPTPPHMRRIIVNDATVEALHVIVSANPAGILFLRDELTGWLSQLDRPGREGERAFYLEMWNGNTGYMSDRIGRGFTSADACCMSMLGGIQPARLRSYLSDALNDGPGNDGLIQRFQLLIWPDTPANWRYVDRPVDEEAKRQVVQVFQSIVELDVETPALMRFDPDAQELFIEWLSKLEAKVRGDELYPALISHLAKYRSLMPSLALLFEVAERAGREGFDASSLALPNNLVSLEHSGMAAAWCDDYLESQAYRIYSCVVKPQIRAARELAKKIKERKIAREGILSVREVYLKGWSGLDSPEAAKQAAEVLEDLGWIRALPNESGPLGGRPAHRFQVNPKIWKQ
jgi:putative DNA primase/helicase